MKELVEAVGEMEIYIDSR